MKKLSAFIPALFLALLSLASPFARAQISLFTAVDLARRNSVAVRLAQTDATRTFSALQEQRDVYLPAISLGSSVGYSYGFPIGQPSIYNVQAQSLVFSFSQPDYIRASRAALLAANLNLKDALNQVELDTALDYIQLNLLTEQIAVLEQQKLSAERLSAIEQDRVTAGVENHIAATRAELSAAQADLRRIDLESQQALIRERLAHLTGLPVESIRTLGESIPAPPPLPVEPLHAHLASVDAALSNAQGKHSIARGDTRQIFRPQVSLAIAYSRYSNINNYNSYYLNFQQNNLGAGVQINLPLFDAVRKAHARGSAADAVHADAQAEQARQQGDESLLQAQRSLPALRAQARIADLQASLAAQQLQSLTLQLAQPPVVAGAAPVTPADEMEARIEERARASEVLQAHFLLLKAEISILRLTGDLTSWVNSAAH